MVDPTIRVLLVEDDEDDYILARTLLDDARGLRIELNWVTTLTEALEKQQKDRHDVVLLDLTLPDAMGWAAFERMRENTRGAPIILLTGLQDESLGVRAVKEGAQDYLCKGAIGTEAFVRSIRYAIERAQAKSALRQSEERYRQLISATPTYTYSVRLNDDESSTTTHGAGCLAVTGYTPYDYEQDEHLWINMVPLEDREQVVAHATWNLHNESRKPIEHRVRHRDGHIIWVRNTIVHHTNAQGDYIGYDGLIEEITERKEAEAALRKARDELEQTVASRTADLARSNEDLRRAVARLEELDRAKTRFVSNVSHELRTPLSSMGYAIENLLKGVLGEVPERIRSYLLMLQEDCQRLRNTISDILDLSRIDEHNLILHRSPVPVGDIVESVTASLVPTAESKSITLTPRIDTRIFANCDSQKIERAVMNVVQNAIKYTPSKGHITVSVSEHDDDSGVAMAVIDVVDTGLGIAPEYIDRVMERYFRIGEHVDGTGLGLAICKEIMDMHGGSLTLTSPPPDSPQGTLVSLRLPTITPPLLLLATTDPALIEAAARVAEAEGYRLNTVERENDIVSAGTCERPDLLIVHGVLSGLDGSELLIKLRAEPEFRTVPAVLLTTDDLSDGKRRLLKNLDVRLDDSPLSAEHLTGLIARALRSVPGSDEGPDTKKTTPALSGKDTS